MGGHLVKSHSSHRSGTLPISLQLRIDRQTDGLPQQRAGPQREPTAQPVTQLRRNGSSRPGGVGARQATQPSHRSLSLWNGKNNKRQAAGLIGVTPRCVLYNPVRRGTKGRSHSPAACNATWLPLHLGLCSLIISGQTEWDKHPASLPACVPHPAPVCTILSKFLHLPQPKYQRGREQLAAHLLTIFQPQYPSGKLGVMREGPSQA